MAATMSPQATGPQAKGPLRMTGGRRAALAIGVPVCLALVGALGLSLATDFAEGSYPVSRTIPAATKALTLNVTGQLTIQPTRARQGTVTGKAMYSVLRSSVTEHTSGDATTLGYGCEFFSGNCGLDATVTIPSTITTLTASSGGGDATVTGTTGPLNLSSGDGNLSVDHASGPLALNTDSGDIRVSAITSAAMSASTGDGSLQATGVASPTISMNTNSGAISGSGIATTSISATSGDGSIVIAFSSVPRDVYVDTDSGSITLLLPPGPTQYHVAANTDSGNISDGSLPKTTNAAAPNQISASTGDGNITISQQ
jgi:hypothetical protein